MNGFNEKMIPEDDFLAIFSSCTQTTMQGYYDLRDVWTIYINKKLSNESQIDTYNHELMHLHLVTSTSFGHVQQILANLISILKIDAQKAQLPPQFILNPYEKIFSLLCEASWEVQEGAAILYSYLQKNNFSGSLVLEKTYEKFPTRYRNATCNFATGVGAILPQNLHSKADIFATAVAQFCLNTDIMKYLTNILKKNNVLNFYDVYRHLSNGKNHPLCRLYALIGELYNDKDDTVANSINDQFVEYLKSSSVAVTEANNHLFIKFQNQKELIVANDFLNRTILTEINKILPEWSTYSCVAEMKEDHAMLLKILAGACNIKVEWDHSLSEDLAKRVLFEPKIKRF